MLGDQVFQCVLIVNVRLHDAHKGKRLNRAGLWFARGDGDKELSAIERLAQVLTQKASTAQNKNFFHEDASNNTVRVKGNFSFLSGLSGVNCQV